MKALAIGLALAVGSAHAGVCADGPPQYDAVIAKHAQANGVPESLIRRIILRESRYNPSARNGPYYGMMQISTTTARGMGYRGAPAGLLDPDVNLTYAVRYLSGAYKTAGGDHNRAVGYYARGYYYDAKRKGLLAAIGLGRDGKLSNPGASPTGPAMAAPAATVQLASTARPVAGLTAAGSPAATPIPMPPMRGPVAPTTPTLATAATPSAASQVLASASPAVPLPPVRGARDMQSVPETTGSIARAAPTPPIRPATAAPQQVATNVPTPPVSPKATAPKQAGPQRPRTLTSVPAPAMASSIPGAPAGAPLAFAAPESRGAGEAEMLRGSNTPLPPRR